MAAQKKIAAETAVKKHLAEFYVYLARYDIISILLVSILRDKTETLNNQHLQWLFSGFVYIVQP